MTPTIERPRLRRGLAAGQCSGDSSTFTLWDQRRLTHRSAELTIEQLEWVKHFDGASDYSAIGKKIASQNGPEFSQAAFAQIVAKLDTALLLESDTLLDYVNGPVREPSCIGSYAGEPAALRKQIDKLFTASGGPGLPAGPPPKSGSLRAVLVPHMDYGRGGVTYGHGFRELFDNTSAKLFVIIATSHYSGERFTLTRQNFRTPLGDVETDQKYVDRIAKLYGEGLFDDPFAHLPEHSIELEVVLLQYLYETHGPFRIVPLLVGSFRDAVEAQQSPGRLPDVEPLVAALRAAEADAEEEVCYIISGDLAHVGPKFEDPEPVGEPFLSESKQQDQLIVRQAESADPDSYYRVIADEQDRRRICGLPPTWTTLAAAQPSRGRLLHYQQYVHPEGFESVSFASMAFDK